MKEMTTSFSKGNRSESSDEHNDRKTNLEKASEKKKDAFYNRKGHEHIFRQYTYLNDDMLIEKPVDAYDRLFEKSVKEYNDKQKRKDRMIGKGTALTREEKKAQYQAWSMVHDMRKLSKKNQKTALAEFAKHYPKASEALQGLLDKTDNMSLKDIRKQMTLAKHADTLGKAYYDKQRTSKQARPAIEFVVQIGNAEDFNEIDDDGNIVKSYDRTDPNGIWQRSKKVLKDYYKEFKKNNPYLVPINASIHMDENCPHMHLKVIPVADASKTTARGKTRRNGLSLKASFNGALECEGFKRDPKDNRAQFTLFQNREADSLAKIMQNELGVSRKKGITNHIKNVHEYKYIKHLEAQEHAKYVAQKEAHEQEIAQLETQKATKQQELTDVSNDVQNSWDTLSKQNQQIKANNKILAEHQSELDDLDNYSSLVFTYQTKANKAKQEQIDAEAKRDKALQAQKEAEKAKKLAEEQAKLANQNLINRLNEKAQKLEEQKEKQKARDVDLNAREIGGKDSKGIMRKGIWQRENAVKERENDVAKKEANLRSYDVQIADKQKALDAKKAEVQNYSNNLENKKQNILAKKNKELQATYAKKRQKLDDAYNSKKQTYINNLKSLRKQRDQLAESNKTQSKFVTYASFIYHTCAETFIKTIDPETNKSYFNGFHESKNTQAYDMAHGNYHDAMNPSFSGKTGLENCIQEYHVNDNRKRLWKALRATGKKFAELINTKQAKTLIRQLDEIDESGISEEAVKQADNAEIKYQQEFWKKQKQEKQQQRKQKLHIGLRPVAKNDDLENPYDN